jgi:hypothetical protein
MSLDVNLGITSVLGVKRSTKRLEGPRPVMQTTKTLNGESFPDEGMTLQTKVLVIDQLSSYNIRYENTSTPQTVNLTNFGNSTLTVALPILASNDGVDPIFAFNPTDDLAGSIIIPPGTTSTFQLSYYGREVGTWSNALLLVSDTDIRNYKLITQQTVSNVYDFDIVPGSYVSTVTVYARSLNSNFTIVPYQGVTELLTASIPVSPGYRVVSYNTTTVTVQFDPNLVDNIPGTYSTVLTVIGNSISHTASVTTIVSETVGNYANYGSWLSPASYYNSAIGVSYDNIDGRNTVTIGVGIGGTDIPNISNGGGIYANADSLSIGGGEVDPKYPHWACVFRIPVNATGDTVPRAYFSGELDLDGQLAYLDKISDSANFYEYFGDYSSQGSMFIVHDDGNGNIRIEMNRLRELSDDDQFNATLQNLSRAFYYYSGVDVPSRYPENNIGNLELLPLTPSGEYAVDGTLTKMFLGFLKNGQVVTSIVDQPVAD